MMIKPSPYLVTQRRIFLKADDARMDIFGPYPVYMPNSYETDIADAPGSHREWPRFGRKG